MKINLFINIKLTTYVLLLFYCLPQLQAIHLSKHFALDTYASLLRESQEDVFTLAKSIQQSIKATFDSVNLKDNLDDKIAIAEEAVSFQMGKIDSL